ncbi:MAG: 4Fe-4S double cluster binding domain-containing protein, partial [Phycisphaeraceae bacterium]
RCVSYLTIEHRESIAPDLHEPLGDHIFGCDVCQDVCPYNQPSRLDRLENAGADIPHTPPDPYAARPSRLDVLDVLGWDEAARREAFTRSAMKRAKLDQMKRIDLLVAANYLRRSDDPALLARIKAIATTDDEPPLVKQTAHDILKTLPPTNSAR